MEESGMKKEITVDYKLLKLQRFEFERRLWDKPSELLTGLLILIEEIEDQRPFPEGEDT